MNLTDQQRTVLECVQVNVPFRMLVESYLELFVKNGINPEIGIDADALDRFRRSDFERVADALGACGARITMHGPFIDLSAGSKDCRIREVTRQRLQQLLDIAPLFNPVTVVCHAGYDAKRYDFFREVWIENSLVVWSWLAGELNRLGSRLMLENVYEKSPLELKVLLEGRRDNHVGAFQAGQKHIAFRLRGPNGIQQIGAARNADLLVHPVFSIENFGFQFVSDFRQ